MAYKKQKGGPKMYRKDGALPMKSPMKNINNMKAYSKPGDAVQFGDGIKMHGKHDGPKMYGSPNEMEKAPTYMKSPNEMKSSGFKMKSGSPFQRNFGIGASPVKAAKPDYPDIDGDGNTTESMKQAAADKKGPLEMASPMKVVGKYIDGELVDDATYKDFVMKNKELDSASEGVGSGGGTDEEQAMLKEHFGDDFMTEKEFVLKNNPNLYYEDGGFYEKGTHAHIQSDFGYNKYFQDKGEVYTGDKQKEKNMHLYGTTDYDEMSEKDEASNWGQQSGITGAPRVTLTGQDLVNDYQRQYQTFKKQNPKAGATFSDFLKKNNLMDTYEEAQSFVRSGAEDPKTLNREDLTDQ